LIIQPCLSCLSSEVRIFNAGGVALNHILTSRDHEINYRSVATSLPPVHTAMRIERDRKTHDWMYNHIVEAMQGITETVVHVMRLVEGDRARPQKGDGLVSLSALLRADLGVEIREVPLPADDVVRRILLLERRYRTSEQNAIVDAAEARLIMLMPRPSQWACTGAGFIHRSFVNEVCRHMRGAVMRRLV
jgi:hypothetical protein